MTEKILNKRPNGMAALIGFSLLYIVAIAVTILCALPLDSESGNAGFLAGIVIGIIWLCIGWLPFMGLKIIKPQESLVLTLFGRY